jgi:hypothetical protein
MTKNLFAVFHFLPALLLAAAAWIALFSFAPIGFLFLRETRAPALISLASVAGLYVLSSRTSRISALYAALFPIGAALVVYSMLRSMLVTVSRRGVIWRGTFYPLAELRKHSGRPSWRD